MTETKSYIERLLLSNHFSVTGSKSKLLEVFVLEEGNIEGVKQIRKIQDTIMGNWAIKARLNEIMDMQLVIPNATVNKPYSAKLDLAKYGLDDLTFVEFDALEEYGLIYDAETGIISGTPVKSGDFKINMRFAVKAAPEGSTLNDKMIPLVINADPKSLWKDIPSVSMDNNYWKPDQAASFSQLGDKHIVVASKRGRSHANVGSFRDDDFAYKHLEDTGWSVVCVADGAGSATLSRQGSLLACNAVIDFIGHRFTTENLHAFDDVLLQHNQTRDEATAKQISQFVYNNLSQAALFAHKEIEAFANKIERPLKDFHTTLIFTLIKKYDFGYAILSFGVGDCPIGLLNKDITEVKLMNWLDVGEFGGGTRFITMPEIFANDKFTTRFGFTLTNDFSYLILMTDGIYDPKFVVENNLEKIEKWQEFLADLQGNNEEKATVHFTGSNSHIADELLSWMDFWSPGNHDDRTLAIIF